MKQSHTPLNYSFLFGVFNTRFINPHPCLPSSTNNMDYSLRLRKPPQAKENSSLRANCHAINLKSTKRKNAPKGQTPAHNSTNTPLITQKSQTKKQNSLKQGSKNFLTRKHLYNSNEITEIRDLRTGKSEFKSKATIKYVMDDYNQIVKMGSSLLNVSPFSANSYKQTEWRFAGFQERDKQCINTECTTKISRGDLKDQDQKMGCLDVRCKAQVAAISKSEELQKGFQIFDIQNQSKSSELFKRFNEGNTKFCRHKAINSGLREELQK